MPVEMNDKIKQGFSASAKKYDLFSGLHREIADKLLDKIKEGPKPSALLDVGCGTGYLTIKAKEYFSGSKIIGVDFSQAMLNVANLKHDSIAWVLTDAHRLPFSDGCFNIVVSNLAYQWANDLSQVFTEARRVMASNGILVCTLFGYDTCQELFQSLVEAKPGALRFVRLPDELQIRKALVASGFKSPRVDVECIKREFKDMHELMAWLKSIGANHLSRQGFLGPGAMSRATDIYRERFSYLQGVGATFEVIWVYARK